ncbi:hypothetical protein HMPREF9551_04631 [Escherichia coli MS 196-1]|nr:hypothetical protein HMPREF9551_04631 [Escherichia coli MS 196-1]
MLRHIFLLSIRAMARAFFCSKVTGVPPFHDVNVTQFIVIDYYYHYVITHQYTMTIKEKPDESGYICKVFSEKPDTRFHYSYSFLSGMER